MIDYANKEAIFTAIKANRNDNPSLFAIAKDIASAIRQANKQQDNALQALQTLQDKATEGQSGSGRPPLTDDATEDEVRTRARLQLVDKLNDGSITAAEFAQFKDVFGLASKTDDLHIEAVEFANVVEFCPKCGANVLEPSSDPADAANAPTY